MRLDKQDESMTFCSKRTDNALIYLQKEIDEIYDYIFPLTIVKDRYMGVYSGGLFTAWNMYSECVPEEIGDDDCTAFDFWNNDSKAYIIGIGKTPDEAVHDLYLKLKRRDKDENNTGKVVFRQIINKKGDMTIYGKEQVLDEVDELTIIDCEEENNND